MTYGDPEDDTNTRSSRAYKGGALNTNDPLRVRMAQEFRGPPSHKRFNLGFRCVRTVCIPRLHQG